MVCTIMFIFQYNQKAFQGQIGLSDLSIIKFYVYISQYFETIPH